MNNVIKQEGAENDMQYYVVKNDEEQYSIWPIYKQIPEGWRMTGEAQDKESCLSYISEVWTDIRPLSLRIKMEELRMDAKKIYKANDID